MPQFVVLSGALLLNHERVVSVRDVFSKRLPKLLIPLVACKESDGIQGVDNIFFRCLTMGIRNSTILLCELIAGKDKRIGKLTPGSAALF